MTIPEEELRELLELGVREVPGGSPALVLVVRAAVPVLGTLRVTLTGQGGVVPAVYIQVFTDYRL